MKSIGRGHCWTQSVYRSALDQKSCFISMLMLREKKIVLKMQKNTIEENINLQSRHMKISNTNNLVQKSP